MTSELKKRPRYNTWYRVPLKMGISGDGSGYHFYISKGRIVAAMPKDDFIREFSKADESLEETMLRLEGGAIHA